MTNTNASMLLKFLISGNRGVCLGHAAAPRQHHFVDCHLEILSNSANDSPDFPWSHWSSCLLAFACLDFVSSLPWLSDIFALFIEVFHWSLNGFDTETTSAASDCAGHRIQVDGRESFTVGVVQPHRTPDRKPYQAVISAKDRCLNLI